MKKIASLLLVLLLVIAIAAPAMALGSNMEYISCDARVIPADGKTYTISTRTGASRTNITGMMTCDMNANLSISLVVEIATVGGTYLRNRTFSNIESGKSVSVSGSESVPEMFSSVDASYFVNGKLGLEYSIS